MYVLQACVLGGYVMPDNVYNSNHILIINNCSYLNLLIFHRILIILRDFNYS